MNLAILGIKIDKIKKNEVLEKIKFFLLDHNQHYITTPNPEIILVAQRDNELMHIINNADISLPDGIGLKFAGWLSGENIFRITGADLLVDILNIANQQKLKTAILIWEKGLSRADEVKNSIINRFNYEIFCEEIARDWKNYKVDNLQKYLPDIIIVSLGAPWQEKLIYHNLKNFSNTKLFIGIGGAVDFLTDKIKRAPEILRMVGLEWLWRLLIQPWRIKRIFNAVLVFPTLFLKQKFINRLFYRKNVVGFLVNSKEEVLILNWCREGDYWGLPQGGVNIFENKKNALAREMLEETGTDNFKIVKSFFNIYKYKWPESYTNTGYKGQKQSLFILKYFGKNDDIKINFFEHKDYKWVKIENLIDMTDKVHQKAYSLFLEKFYETKF